MENLSAYQDISFLGTSTYRLDSKNRICLCPDFIAVLDTKYKSEHRTLVTCLDWYRCVAIYPVSEYYRASDRLVKMSAQDPSLHKIINIMRGTTSKVTPDSQNRIVLREDLLRYAGILGSSDSQPGRPGRKPSAGRSLDVLVTGATYYIQVWGMDRWNEYMNSNASLLDDKPGFIDASPIIEEGR